MRNYYYFIYRNPFPANALNKNKNVMRMKFLFVLIRSFNYHKWQNIFQFFFFILFKNSEF